MFALLVFILCYFLILLYNFPETLSTLNQYIQYFYQKHHISHLSLAVLFLSSVIFLKVKKLGKSPSLIPNVKNYLITSGNSVVIIILKIYFCNYKFLHFYSIPYNIPLQIAAAKLLPPFLPLATITGTLHLLIISFASTTFTKPTGTAIISTGFILFSSINSFSFIRAVGALPTAIIYSPSILTPFP